jgi:hypothetical protein
MAHLNRQTAKHFAKFGVTIAPRWYSELEYFVLFSQASGGFSDGRKRLISRAVSQAYRRSILALAFGVSDYFAGKLCA